MVSDQDLLNMGLSSALHLDTFTNEFSIRPFVANLIALRICWVETLNEQVFAVGKSQGHSPGDAVIVPHLHQGRARYRHAGDVERFGTKVIKIP